MEPDIISKIENLPNTNPNIQKCVMKEAKDGTIFYRADVKVTNDEKHYTFSVYICDAENEIVLTDSQWFFDSYIYDRDNLKVY